MRILILSYMPLEEEGRLLRSFYALNEHYDVYLIDVAGHHCKSKNRTTINLIAKNSMLRYIEYLIKCIKEIRKIEYDLIYSHNYFTALVGIVLNIIGKKQLIYDAYEMYFPGSKSKFSLRDRIFYFFEKIAIKKSVEVICASEERALIMLGHYRLKKLPVVVRNINNHNLNLKKREFDIESKSKVVYAGYLSNDRYILELIESIADSNLLDRVQLDIYGKGPISDKLNIMSNSGEYPFFKFKGSYQNQDLKTIFSEYNIGYVAYPNDGYNNIFCSSNKLFDYVSNGLVVIAPYNYTLEKIINSNKIGICSNDIVNSIEKVLNNYIFYYDNLKLFYNDNLWSNEKEKLLKVFANYA